MNQFCSVVRSRAALILLLLPALLVACGGGHLDPVLGTPGLGAAPTVSATSPAASTPAVTGVASNSSVSATFSKPMAPATITAANFTVACSAAVPLAAAVTYDTATQTATLAPTAALPASSPCVATVTTAVQDSTGIALAAPFVWNFVTAAPADVAAPTVILTVPAAGAANVPGNTKVTAVFSEDMAAATLTGATFTVVNTTLGTAVAGSVAYSATGRMVSFTPSIPAALPDNTSFTATLSTGVTDVAGNTLAATFSWSFTTAALADTTRPSVVLTVPAAGATQVANNTRITATFSEDIDASTLSGATFVLTNTNLGSTVTGTVGYSAASRTVTLTPSTPAALADDTLFSATLGSGVKDLAGNALLPYTWTFTTAALGDTTRPTVTVTVPAASASGVANNTRITATFSENMDPATLSISSFTLVNSTLGAPVAGSVNYSVASRTATFTTSSGTIASNTSFTATISSAAADLAGNALAGNASVAPGAGAHVWSFTTAAGADTTAPTVLVVSPANGSANVCLSKSVSASFSEPMDASTVDIATFGVTDTGVAVAGSVSYDAATQAATFTAADPAGFAAGRTFVATVRSGTAGVKDLAGNALAADRTWSFTTGSQTCGVVVNLRTAASFGAFGGGAGVTNSGTHTVVGGNLGTTAACTLFTGFHDAANVYTETPLNRGAVNGSVFCGPPAPGTTTTLAVATRARADALSAYNALAAMPPGSDPGAGQLGGLVLPPAVYTSAGGTFAITGGDLTLDAQGDPNAVWVFQSAAALTVGLPATPRRVALINGAQAKNVFWQVGSAARIEDRSTMVGTIIAPAGVTISTAGQTAQTTLTGRALGLTASVTMVNTTIVAP